MRRVPFYGLSVVCGDDPNVRAILRRVASGPDVRVRSDNHLRAIDLVASGLQQEFTVECRGFDSAGQAGSAGPP